MKPDSPLMRKALQWAARYNSFNSGPMAKAKTWLAQRGNAPLLRAGRRLAACDNTRLLLWGCCLSVALLLLWAAWAEIDELARGSGQVVPS